MDTTLATSRIPLSVPSVGDAEWEYLKECLETGWLSSVGPFVDRFEQMVAAVTGRRYAIATVNGTAALHVALIVAGIEPDDEVLVSTLTFIAPANAIRYMGAWPVFVDAEPRYWQIDPRRLEEFLERDCVNAGGDVRNRTTGRRVRAILPVSVLGHSADLEPIHEIARRYGLMVIADAAESLGARYRGRPVAAYGESACLSFNGNKLITTGGGGMFVTDREDWATAARYLTTQAKDDPIEYVHGCVGYNYRLTNLQAAVGCAQLERLEAYVDVKRRIAREYARALSDVPGITPMAEAPDVDSTFWMYTVLVDAKQYGMDARALQRHLTDENIESRPLWQPISASPAHREWSSRSCPVAEALYEAALSLPCSVSLTDAQQARVIDIVRASCRRR